MTLAQIITELEALPAQLESDLPKIEAEILATENLAQPEVDLLKMFMPQVEAAVKAQVASLEAAVEVEIAKLPPEVAAIVNKYLLPIESGIQF